MIKNFVFDMGGVLREYRPMEIIERMGVTNPEDQKILFEEVLYSKEWTMMDRGLFDEDEGYEIIKKNVPERLHEYTKTLVFHWDNYSGPMPGMKDFLLELKNDGYKLYALSNASTRLRKQYWYDIPGHDLFDGMVISSDVKLMKPDPQIFRYLLEKYSLKAEECLFIDDSQLNTEAAMFVGFKAVTFHYDTDRLKMEVEEVLENENRNCE